MISHQILTSSKMWVTLTTLSALLTACTAMKTEEKTIEFGTLQNAISVVIHGRRKKDGQHSVELAVSSMLCDVNRVGLRETYHIKLSIEQSRHHDYFADAKEFLKKKCRSGFTLDFPAKVRGMLPKFAVTKVAEDVVGSGALRLRIRGSSYCGYEFRKGCVTLIYEESEILGKDEAPGHNPRKQAHYLGDQPTKATSGEIREMDKRRKRTEPRPKRARKRDTEPATADESISAMIRGVDEEAMAAEAKRKVEEVSQSVDGIMKALVRDGLVVDFSDGGQPGRRLMERLRKAEAELSQ